MASGLIALAACGGDEPESGTGSPSGPGTSTAGPAAPAGSDIIYQVNPRFYGDSECFGAIRSDLPRIAGMGCDILWIMPHYLPGELKSVGSPYCIRDYKKVNPRYGTMADLKALVDEAHRLGMKVIFDWVANHTSFDNVWTVTNPERYRKDAQGNIAATASWGDVAQLDFSTPSTLEGMTEAMNFWITECGIDGYRCDYTEGVPHDFWQKAIASVRKDNPSFLMLAESSRTDFYADGFDMVYDWNFSPAMSGVFKGGRASDLMQKSAATLSEVPEGKSILRYAFNHDVAAENALDTYFGSIDALPAAYTLACMLGGTPMIYSGMDADGVRGKLSFFNHMTLDFSDARSAVYKKINDAYKATADLRNGELLDYSTREAVNFTRSSAGDTMLVIVNTTDADLSVKTPITLAGSEMTELIGGTKAPLPVSVTLPPYGYVIYRD